MIDHDTERDFYLDAQQAVEYGLVDKVLDPTRALIIEIDIPAGWHNASGSFIVGLIDVLITETISPSKPLILDMDGVLWREPNPLATCRQSLSGSKTRV